MGPRPPWPPFGRPPLCRPRRGRRLFWRVYLQGILLLVAVFAAAGVSSWLIGGRSAAYGEGALGRLAEQLARDLDSEQRLRQRLEELEYVARVDLAIYDDAGRRIAAAGERPPARLSADEARQLQEQKIFHRAGVMQIAVPIRGQGEGAYLLIGWRGQPSVVQLLLAFSIVLVALALVAVPLARAITRPLERITDTARALGQGDLSARTGLERRRDEVGDLARVLDDMAGRLQHRLRAEKELWAAISHEIRTPLARIRVALELCEEERGGPQAIRAHLAGIGEDIAELEQLVNDVLVTVRLDLASDGDGQSGFTLRRERTSVATMLDEVARRFAEYHPDHELRREGSADVEVEGDPALLKRVVSNLLDNAVKHSGVGPEAPLELACSVAGGEVLIEVRDQGAGVSEEDLPHLFDHFFRTDRSRSRDSGGTGLGLTMCQRVVEAHGGQIEASNRAGGGLVIRFRLPVVPSTAS